MKPNMDSGQHLESVEDEAARWFWKKDGEGWSDSDQAALQAWLDASTSHRIAFLRLSAAWKAAARMQALGAGVAPGMVPPVGEWGNDRFPAGHSRPESADAAVTEQSPRVKQSSPRPVAVPRLTRVAAMLVVGVAIAMTVYSVTTRRGAHYETAVGGLNVVPLGDGSRMTLNTDTQVHVTLTGQERRVVLSRGEAFFEVAKDAARPFVVHAGDRRVVAVGTKFSVRRTADDVQVIVTEGRVKLEQEAVESAATLLDAGAVARVMASDVKVSETSADQAEEMLSWRNGYLKFDATPLGEAVAEFNRYNERQIVIDDPAIAQLQVGGNFRPGNTAGFLQFVQTAFPVQVVTDQQRIVLRRRQASVQ